MRLYFISLIFIPFMASTQNTVEPKAKKVPKELTIHEHTRIDPYYWMNERDSKDVLKYIKEEKAISKAFFKKQKNTITELLDEFEKRIDPNEVYAPYKTNGVVYQETYTEGDDYLKTFIVKNGVRELFIDENARAKKKPYYELADWNPSPNNKYVALAEDYVGRRNYTITIRNYNDQTFLEDKIEGTDGSMEWLNDNKSFIYVKFDPQTLRSYQVYLHQLGTSQKEDILLYEDLDEKFGVGIEKSLNDKYILITSASTTTTEVYLMDANNSEAKPSIFLKREQGHEYSVHVHNQGFYIVSNKNAANRQILFSPEVPSSIQACKNIVEHNKTFLIEGIAVLDKYLLISGRTNGLEEIQILDLANNKKSTLQQNEETYSISLWTIDDYYTTEVEYMYNSMTTPSSLYKVNLENGNKKLTFTRQLLDKTFSPDQYESKRIWVKAEDGTKVAVSIVYKKGIDLAKAPCFLYGYGSYGITLPDIFSTTRITLLNRGFVYAQAHIRGEKYLGEEWYQNGKFLNKKNTFTDFIDVAKYLGENGYCNPEKIYANGGSAGGLLMGAVLNMAPELFKGVIADVPFVDVVTTMLDETIPLTVGEFEEWGNPKDEEYYQYMLSYSPYDNVEAKAYPNLLITTGYHDSQVQYWEPLKWIAKLRDKRTNANLLMLDCNMDAGHGGGSGRSSERLELAKMYAFILELEK